MFVDWYDFMFLNFLDLHHLGIWVLLLGVVLPLQLLLELDLPS